jgi:hypothetical protein
VKFDELNGNFSESAALGAIKDSDFQGRFSATQAEDFVAHWEVVSHQQNTASGFSATLFKNKDSGEYVYAVRGTEGPDYDDLLSAMQGTLLLMVWR